MSLQKYLQTFQLSWENGFVYRLNFIMWRVRVLLQVLMIYFLWSAVLKNTQQFGGYTQAQMLTYIIGTSLMRAIVFSSQSQNIQSDIGSGDLNNYLIKPLNYFGYWFSRDLADKILNILFSLVELTVLFWILKPPIIFPDSLVTLIGFIVVTLMAMVLYFFFSLNISLSVFWMPEGIGWPQRFLVFVILEFLSGALFPLDILPQALYQIIGKLPTAYMLNVPLQVYLGKLTVVGTVQAMVVMLGWIGVFYLTAMLLFRRGVKIYGAYGR